MKFSICIESIFESFPFEGRVKLVHEIGFNTIELWDPSIKDLDKLKEECIKYNVSVALCALKANKRLNTETKDFINNFEESIPLVKKINCKKVICLTGEIEKGKTIEEQKSRIITNLKAAAKISEREDINIVLESLNSYVDHKDYFLDSSKLGFEIIKEVNHDRVKFLYDIYHMQIMEGNIISTIKNNINLIGHFHSAGIPGRHEHYIGELNYHGIINAIKETAYKGYFGLEYWPSIDNVKSLQEVVKYLGIQ